MPASFSRAVEWVISHEGGYVHHPSDPGQATKYGISQRAYPNMDIKNLTLMEAQTIYERDYWKPSLAYQIVEQRLATKYLDMCVNFGVTQGCKTLQLMLNYFLPNSCAATGVPSDATINTLNGLAKSRDVGALVGTLGAFMIVRYASIVQSRPDKSVFAYGWARRALDLPPA